MRRIAGLAIAAALAAAPAAAQGGHSAADHGAMATQAGMPDGWLMRFDRSNAAAEMVSFRTMDPGWHVTTGRAGAGIFWRPDLTASGQYRAATTIHLMEPAQHAEAFGIFVGGESLGEQDQRYLYFLVRQNGQYLIKRRNGADTENVVGWTAHDAVPTATAGESTRYDLVVTVGAETVDFSVNGTTVHSLPRASLRTDGVVGVRVNHMLDVHVQSLDVTKG